MGAKKGDKFIIEVAEEYLPNPFSERGALYRMKGFNTLVFDGTGLSKLEKVDEAMYEAYKHGTENRVAGLDLLKSQLREAAEWADGNIRDVPINLPDVLRQAADELERVSDHGSDV